MENQHLEIGQIQRPAGETVQLPQAGQAERSFSAGFTYPPGSQILAGYTIKRGIGQGGFGEVYYATSEAGKEVALKLIRRNQQIELRGLRQCLNLKHPNLVNIYDIRQDGQDNYWVIMEYVAGPSLQERIAQFPHGLPEQEVLQWVRGIVAGVGYLHEHGIVHRDLKPANIFQEEGIVKIGDYGLSKFISATRRSGQTESVGTVHYMAPEVANGRYGQEIDIYALGIILYEMLTGRVPFEGESVAEVLMKHLTAQPDLTMLADPYRSVVARALEKDPEKRFPSMAHLWEALQGGSAVSEENQLAPASHRIASQTSGAPSAPGQVADGTGTQATVNQGQNGAGQGAPATTASFPQRLRLVPSWCMQVWNGWKLSTPMKLLVVGLGIFAFWALAPLLLPLAVVGVVGYVGYGLGRKMWGGSGKKDTAGGVPGSPEKVPILAEVHPRAGTPPLPSRATPYERAAYALIWKSPLERITELLGSLTAGGIATLILCLIVVMFYSFRQEGQMLAPEQIAWVVVMSMVGTWGVLIVSKFWEGTYGEPILRRSVLLLVGLGLGLIGYGLSRWLWVDLGTLENFPRPHPYPLPPRFYGPGGEPLLMAFLATFGLLMGLIRWWRQADPLRFTRLNLWSVLVCVFGAAIVAGIFRFPQPWLPMVAGVMSVSIQMAAPWSHPRRRYLNTSLLLMGLLIGTGTLLGPEMLRESLGSESGQKVPSSSAPSELSSQTPQKPAPPPSASPPEQRIPSEGSSNVSQAVQEAWMTRMLREEFYRWLTSRSELLFSQMQAEFERWLAFRGSDPNPFSPEPNRPEWVETPSAVIDGEYWHTVKAGPATPEEDGQALLRTEIQKAVAAYAEKRFGDPFAQQIDWNLDPLLPQILADQWKETRLTDFGPQVGRQPIIWIYGRLRFSRQVQEEICRQYRQAVIHVRLKKLVGGMTGLLVLLGLSYGVLRFRCHRLYPQRPF